MSTSNSPKRGDEKKEDASSNLLGLFDPPTPVLKEKKSPDEIIQQSLSKNEDDEGHAEEDEDADVDDNNDNSDDDQAATVDSDVPGSLSHFMSLFAPPSSLDKPALGDRQSTVPRSNLSNGASEATPLLESSTGAGLHTPQSSFDWRDSNGAAQNMLMSMMGADTPKTHGGRATVDTTASNLPPSHARLLSSSHVRAPSAIMPPITEGKPQQHLAVPDLDSQHQYQSTTTTTIAQQQEFVIVKEESKGKMLSEKLKRYASSTANALKMPSTYIGSFMYLLYHVVFCLALGSAIMRPNNPTSLLGLMTKTAALGTVSPTPLKWFSLSKNVPALYPTADLFLAPFLAGLALIVDQTLANDASVTREENDAVFLATFGVLTAIGMALSACLLVAASVFKLANLGSFLPFPVICGFFSAVGILTWTLAVNVDTGGKSIGVILTSGDKDLMLFALIHHIPTLIVAGFMKYLGPKNPFFVAMVVFVTISLFYVYMFATGSTLDEMKEEGWFWSHDELVYESYAVAIGFDRWAPPAPFGVLVELRRVHWGAVKDGLKTAIALSFLYLIRCSVHGAALKKNVPNLARKVRSDDPLLDNNSIRSDEVTGDGVRIVMSPKRAKARSRKFSEAVDIEAVMMPSLGSTSNNTANDDKAGDKDAEYVMYHAKPTSATLKEISLTYGNSQIVTAIVGGFAITPSVAASSTMFGLGAEGLAPQIGSVLLLFVFYMTDFQIVGYIPKPAFSSMLVLAFIDMINTWFYRSWFKTKDKSEWLVVPAIVVCAFVLDLLSAVFLGIGFSTLIFVAAFFRSGVVKYVANGKRIHSTIERPFRMSEWLNEEGDLIQVLCLQNYLFFGNASSVFNFIGTAFESDDGGELTPKERTPDYLILDLTLVTGMDTSTVDIFSDIRNLCKSNNCKLLMAGMSPNIRSILALGNFKPDTGVRSKRQVRFFPNLDSALGKAEDMLLENKYVDTEPEPSMTDRRRRVLDQKKDNGFRVALTHIDAEHGENFSLELVGLQKYTSMVEVKTGEVLYDDGETKSIERGLFFIETGVLKVEHSTGDTATRGSFGSVKGLGSLNAGMNVGDTLKAIQQRSFENPLAGGAETFRIARIGVGWVCGTIEFFHTRRPGNVVAVDNCKLHHLPFSKIQEIERKEPGLALTLYKLLSYLMARRQEATIGQLATLHAIMSSPPRWRSLKRKDSSKLQ